jgi:hypothetical protein
LLSIDIRAVGAVQVIEDIAAFQLLQNRMFARDVRRIQMNARIWVAPNEDGFGVGDEHGMPRHDKSILRGALFKRIVEGQAERDAEGIISNADDVSIVNGLGLIGHKRFVIDQRSVGAVQVGDGEFIFSAVQFKVT